MARATKARSAAGGVATYIAGRPTHARPVLRKVRSIIRAALPEAEETISYQIPAYRVDGRLAVYFAGWKERWSLYPVTKPVQEALGPALAKYPVSKGTVRFAYGDPVPVRLVQRIVRTLAKSAKRGPA